MKTLSFIFALTFSIAGASVKASAVELDCMEEGRLYGSKRHFNSSKISQGCQDAVKASAQKLGIYAQSDDLKLRAYGYGNILLIEDESSGAVKLNAIAGEMSSFANIEQLALSPDKKTVAVVNQSIDKEGEVAREILVFSTSRNGNIAPLRINRSPLLKGSYSLSYSADSKEIVLVSKSEEEFKVVSFDSESDSRSPVVSRKPAAVELANFVEGKTPLQALKADEFLIVLLKSGKVLGIPLNQKTEAGEVATNPVWELSQEVIGLEGATKIKLNLDKKILTVSNSSGEAVEFDL